MGKEPPKDDAEVEVICPRCGYHLRRTAERLRRDTPVVCPNCGKQVVPAPPTFLRESMQPAAAQRVATGAAPAISKFCPPEGIPPIGQGRALRCADSRSRLQ
jgi:predicted RNA-binding Zn-ribbon protein involved in translation (DUF1610 family)